MNATFEELKDAAGRLPIEQRKELALHVVNSLDGQVDAEILDEWLEIAERRWADYEAGKIGAESAEDFLNSLPGSKR